MIVVLKVVDWYFAANVVTLNILCVAVNNIRFLHRHCRKILDVWLHILELREKQSEKKSYCNHIIKLQNEPPEQRISNIFRVYGNISRRKIVKWCRNSLETYSGRRWCRCDKSLGRQRKRVMSAAGMDRRKRMKWREENDIVWSGCCSA